MIRGRRECDLSLYVMKMLYSLLSKKLIDWAQLEVKKFKNLLFYQVDDTPSMRDYYNATLSRSSVECVETEYKH